MRLRPCERKIIEAVEQHHGDNEGVVGGIHVSATVADFGGTVRMSDGVVRMVRPSRDASLKTERGRVWRRQWAT